MSRQARRMAQRECACTSCRREMTVSWVSPKRAQEEGFEKDTMPRDLAESSTRREPSSSLGEEAAAVRMDWKSSASSAVSLAKSTGSAKLMSPSLSCAVPSRINGLTVLTTNALQSSRDSECRNEPISLVMGALAKLQNPMLRDSSRMLG